MLSNMAELIPAKSTDLIILGNSHLSTKSTYYTQRDSDHCDWQEIGIPSTPNPNHVQKFYAGQIMESSTPNSPNKSWAKDNPWSKFTTPNYQPV